jgi:7-keto-8-aminopelargonate synthetase-like enzyme
MGEEAETLRVSQHLLDCGIFVPGIRFPTVARGQARLRFTLMATHTREDMDYALDILRKSLG